MVSQVKHWKTAGQKMVTMSRINILKNYAQMMNDFHKVTLLCSRTFGLATAKLFSSLLKKKLHHYLKIMYLTAFKIIT